MTCTDPGSLKFADVAAAKMECEQNCMGHKKQDFISCHDKILVNLDLFVTLPHPIFIIHS